MLLGSLAPETQFDFAVYMARRCFRCAFGVACGSLDSKMFLDDLDPKPKPGTVQGFLAHQKTPPLGPYSRRMRRALWLS